MAKQAFQNVSYDDIAPFKLMLGKMLRSFEQMSEQDYDFVGQVQVDTMLIADAYADTPKSERGVFLERFGGRGPKEGKLDMSSAMFNPKLQRETVAGELNNFLESIGIEKIEEKRANAFEIVHSENGAPEEAAASGVIIRAFCLDGDKATKDAITEASLVMQMATRALDRIDAFEKGEYDRDAAIKLQKLHNKLNYQSDSRPVVQANEALDFICSTEKTISSNIIFALENNEKLPESKRLSKAEIVKHQIQEAQIFHEGAIKQYTTRLIENMKDAAKIYREVAHREQLAKRAENAHTYFTEKYKNILSLPHIMNAPENNGAPHP